MHAESFISFDLASRYAVSQGCEVEVIKYISEEEGSTDPTKQQNALRSEMIARLDDWEKKLDLQSRFEVRELGFAGMKGGAMRRIISPSSRR